MNDQCVIWVQWHFGEVEGKDEVEWKSVPVIIHTHYYYQHQASSAEYASFLVLEGLKKENDEFAAKVFTFKKLIKISGQTN